MWRGEERGGKMYRRRTKRGGAGKPQPGASLTIRKSTGRGRASSSRGRGRGRGRGSSSRGRGRGRGRGSSSRGRGRGRGRGSSSRGRGRVSRPAPVKPQLSPSAAAALPVSGAPVATAIPVAPTSAELEYYAKLLPGPLLPGPDENVKKELEKMK